MLLFAEVSETFISVFAGAVALGWAVLKLVEKMYDNRRADRLADAAKAERIANEEAAIKRTTETQARVEQVAVAVAENTAKVEKVEKHTDGIVTKLEAASFAKGVKSETDKSHGNGT